MHMAGGCSAPKSKRYVAQKVGKAMVIVILVFAAIAAIQGPKIIKDKNWKEILCFMTLFLVGFALNLVLSAGIDLPSPIEVIMDFLDVIRLHN